MPPARRPPSIDPPDVAPAPEVLDLPGADVRWWHALWPGDEADRLLVALLAGIDWQQEEVLIFGQRRRVPRLVAWHGDAGAAYTYSGTPHEPLPWTPPLHAIRRRVEAVTGERYDSVLLNRYRDGRDGMGWHSDDEAALGPEPAIASVSFGATRRFRLKRRRGAGAVDLELGHGDLLLMRGRTQHEYVHSVPKTARPVGERVNLTFRRLLRVSSDQCG
jgi:alkylated DNA repair dioxygenase AlkB